MDETILLSRLKNFLDEGSRLKGYPSKREPKLLSLFFLASKFESGKIYSEKEVNELLKQWHTFGDWAMLRRDLFDHGFLDRERNGSDYRLANPQPLPKAFGINIPEKD